MKEILLAIIAIILLSQLITTSIPEYRECGGYASWQIQYVPARCLNHFINQAN